MPGREILVDAVPGEVRVAVLGNHALTDFLIERSGQGSLVGGLYLGRVIRVVAALDAAFVDIGDSRPALLNLADARPWPALASRTQATRDRIGDYVREGEALPVQVIADPLPGKGARLSARVRIAGRLVGLEPGRPGPPQADDGLGAGERERLQAMIAGARADGDEGIVLLPAAAGAAMEAVLADLARVRERAARIQAARGVARAPACLEPAADAVRMALSLIGAEPPDRIVAEGPDALAAARWACGAFAPDWLGVIEGAAPGAGLFDGAGVTEALGEAYRPVIPLAGGGDIRLATTPALVAVDVNSGAPEGGAREQAAFKLNCRAADAIARLMRLRNEAGAAVIDFVPLRSRARGRQLVEHVRGAFAGDPEPVRVAGFGPLGFVELTRRRRRAPLATWLWRDDDAAHGRAPSDEAAAFAAARRLVGEAGDRRVGGAVLRAAPGVARALEQGVAAPAFAWARERAGCPVRLMAESGAPEGWFDLGPAGG